jgi:hypothetical protein
MLIKILGSPLLTRLALFSILVFGILTLSNSSGAVKACNDAHCWWSIGANNWICLGNTHGPFTNCYIYTNSLGDTECQSGGICDDF